MSRNKEHKKLELMLSQPEGQFVEFKKSISASLGRELVAFANSGGGHIIIGVDDQGKVLGLENINEQISKLESIARNCDPPIPLKISSHNRNGKEILVVEVPDAEDKPYSCSSGFYLRSGASTQKMRRDEIVEFLYSVGQVKYEEKLCQGFRYPTDFDEKAFSRFLTMANISSVGLSTEDILLNLGVAIQKDSGLAFNNAGVLFFGKEPTRFLRHAVVDCILFQDKEKLDVLDRKELRGNLIENVEQAMIFLKRHLSVRYEIKGLYRKEILELPEDALREAVLNAVMHRDYHFDSACISIEIYRNRVEIYDPGGLPPGMRPDDIGKKSVRRNKLIADLFHRVGEVEKIGSGINRIKEMMASSGLGMPRFEFTVFFTITFERPKAQVEAQVGAQVGAQVRESPLSRKILKLCENPKKSSELVEALGHKKRSGALKETIKFLMGEGLIRYTIPEKPTSSKQKYVTTEKGRKVLEKVEETER